MRSPRGFGKNYFSLVAIQAYASHVRLLQNITRIEWICPTHPIHTYSTVSPPKDVLTSSVITIMQQGHSCTDTLFHSLPPQRSSLQPKPGS
ncbi:hypothetical protein E0765_03100 [Sulfuricurvum sp. IAE1]|uniref:hypothetical protein n=1 Tax=Sulfuricurvum sp. IAE1 TaxID=2546102 RepID=UPI001042BF51|nr:hypothetical protein [Sulfuricurvum sp. IAE1]MDD3770216.1 hypothetical protein [Sulfuricurvum sp.]MDX9966106.1 hypothetical protein [Sulfuricurvum sp.]TDA68486.1 hypothetical protein E0765_03100 [Sulfuricurvum sp. IAE1]